MTTFTTNTHPAASSTVQTLTPLLASAAAALRTALTPSKRDPEAILAAQARRAAARQATDNLLR